ncbi:branched-chain amino acid ABC transporter permease [Marivibrio halodurans]|uniref:Branched-chain amino acid ABC transporter permease n=1 Tax=Marivibrio halodurans TaxID=2039722 RepID=A0A8J7SP32_9PROT|nr:branched-chain amino acid ABC transporter permease [Marivibrio halodurans]MBP5858378.1 branched-chain amino acid ABC transporter permease [Marivibrio halodurans]
MTGTLFLQTLVDGLILGGIFSLSAVGFSLIFGVLGVVNLSHGIFVLLGAYLGLALKEAWGIDPLMAIPLVFGALFVLGGLVQITLVSGAVRRGSLMSSLLITFGVSLMLRDLIILVFGPDVQSLSSSWLFDTFRIGGVIVDGARASGLIASLLSLGLLSYVLYRSKVGRAMRATAQQDFAAGLCGIDVKKIYAMTFGVSAGFAGVSGIIVGLINPFTPFDDTHWTLNAFVTVVLGGVGSPVGALLGGLMLGGISTFSSQYVGSLYPNVFIFGALLLMLIVRPNGLLGNAYKGSV